MDWSYFDTGDLKAAKKRGGGVSTLMDEDSAKNQERDAKEFSGQHDDRSHERRIHSPSISGLCVVSELVKKVLAG